MDYRQSLSDKRRMRDVRASVHLHSLTVHGEDPTVVGHGCVTLSLQFSHHDWSIFSKSQLYRELQRMEKN